MMTVMQTSTSTGSGYVLARSLDEIRESGSVVLEGTDVKDAQGGAFQSDKNSSREYAVSLTLTDEGKTKFADATEANVGKQIAIVYDNQILSAPKVNEAITGGQAQITGMSSVEEAQNLASYIRIGSLSIELEELRSSVVAAQLGEEAISTSVMAGADRSCYRNHLHDYYVSSAGCCCRCGTDPVYSDRTDYIECI